MFTPFHRIHGNKPSSNLLHSSPVKQAQIKPWYVSDFISECVCESNVDFWGDKLFWHFWFSWSVYSCLIVPRSCPYSMLVASRRIFEMTGTTVGWCMTGIGITHVPAFSCATKTRSILCAPVTEQSFNCSEIRPLILNLIYSLTSGTHHVKLVTWYFHALQGLYGM